MVLAVKTPPANAGDARDLGLIPGWEDPLEEGMESHSSILAWRTPWTEDRGGLQSMGLQSLTQLKWPSTWTQAMQETPAQFLGWEAPWWRKYQPTLVFSPGESPWTEEPGLWGLQRESYCQRELQSTGSQRVRHDWATKRTVTKNVQLLFTSYLLFAYLYWWDVSPDLLLNF